MSAAAQIPKPFRPERRDSLAQTPFEISRFANGDPDPENLMDFVASRALAIAGVQRTVIDPGPSSTWGRSDRQRSLTGPHESAMGGILPRRDRRQRCVSLLEVSMLVLSYIDGVTT